MRTIALRVQTAFPVAMVVLVSAALTVPVAYFAIIFTYFLPIPWLFALVAGAVTVMSFSWVDRMMAYRTGDLVYPASCVAGAVMGIALGFVPSLANLSPNPKRWFFDVPIMVLVGAFAGTYARWNGDRKRATGLASVLTLVIVHIATYVGQVRGPMPIPKVAGTETPPAIELTLIQHRLVGATADSLVVTGTDRVSAYPLQGFQQAIWSVPLKASPASVLASDGTAYVVVENELAAFRDGEELWWATADPSAYEAVALGGNRVLVAVATHVETFERTLAAIDPATGYQRWTHSLGPATKDHSPSIAVGPSGMTYVSLEKEFRAINDDGSVAWSVPGHSFHDATVARDGSIYVTDNRALMAFDPTGKLLWENNDLGCSHKRVAFSHDESTMYCVDYRLLAMDRSGKVRWQWKPEETAFVVLNGLPTVLTDGSILVGNVGTNDVFLVGPTGALRWRTSLPGRWDFSTVNQVVLTPSRVYLETKEDVVSFRTPGS